MADTQGLEPMTTSTNAHPGRPTLEGDTVASVDTQYSVLIDTVGGWSIRVEGDCTFRRSDVTIEVVDDEFSLLDGALASWVGGTLGELQYGADGGLVVTCGADRLVVPPSKDFEAWGIAGPHQEKVVSLPGGEIRTWSGVRTPPRRCG